MTPISITIAYTKEAFIRPELFEKRASVNYGKGSVVTEKYESMNSGLKSKVDNIEKTFPSISSVVFNQLDGQWRAITQRNGSQADVLQVSELAEEVRQSSEFIINHFTNRQ